MTDAPPPATEPPRHPAAAWTTSARRAGGRIASLYEGFGVKVSRCYSCGSSERSFYAEENGFSLVKCHVCGLLYVEDRPDDEEISDAHRQGRHGGARDLRVTGRFQGRRIPYYTAVLRDLFHEGPPACKTWLDVGCGHGEFMVALRKHSRGKISVKGTEPNIRKQESARRRGLDVSYFSLEGHSERYDVVSLLNVYSHLPDPPGFLSVVKDLLQPGGELVLETGNTADLAAGQHPRPFYLPDHLSFASERIVTDILGRLGFGIVKIVKYPALKVDLQSVTRELLKAMLPGYRSRIGCLFRRRMYSEVDMFVRAKALE